MKKNGKIVFLIWLSVFLTIIACFYFPNFKIENKHQKVNELQKWTYKIENSAKKDIVLPGKWELDAQDTLTLTTTLTDDFKNVQNLCFWSSLQGVKVFVDEKLFYEIDENERFGRAPVSKWNYIEIPENSKGKELRIQFTNTYENYKFVLDSVVYGNMENLEKWGAVRYGLGQILDCIVFLVGICIVIVSIYGIRGKQKWEKSLVFGVSVIMIGIWFRFGLPGTICFLFNGYTRMFLGHAAFYLFPITLLVFIKFRTANWGRMMTMDTILLFVECLVVLTVFAMQALGVRDIQETLWLGYMNMGISIGWSAFITLCSHRRTTRKEFLLSLINIALMSSIGISFYLIQNLQIHVNLIARIIVLTFVVLEMIKTMDRWKERDQMQSKIQRENKNLQLQVLTGQIRPHFILNTLGAIRSMIKQDPEEASDLLYDFSKYIRKNMEQKDYSKVIPFLEELDYIATYLNLETLRFKDKIKVEYDIREDGFWILPLTIQPFVENAVKHGLRQKADGGVVRISTYKKANDIIIEVMDNGVGFDMKDFWRNLDEKKSVGMKSAIRRLEDEMGAECEIASSMQLNESGTLIRITIPEKR